MCFETRSFHHKVLLNCEFRAPRCFSPAIGMCCTNWSGEIFPALEIDNQLWECSPISLRVREEWRKRQISIIVSVLGNFRQAESEAFPMRYIFPSQSHTHITRQDLAESGAREKKKFPSIWKSDNWPLIDLVEIAHTILFPLGPNPAGRPGESCGTPRWPIIDSRVPLPSSGEHERVEGSMQCPLKWKVASCCVRPVRSTDCCCFISARRVSLKRDGDDGGGRANEDT